jgi:iron-sulfur cluster assembly accessory protein
MIEISYEAASQIRAALSKNGEGKVPRIVLKNGGCAGTMLVLVLENARETDSFEKSGDLIFAISNEAWQYVDDVSIYVKHGLGSEIVIKNNAVATCTCGKSFRT